MPDHQDAPVTASTLAAQRILLVGGAVFIGHHLALRLRRAGAEVHVIDALEVNNLGDVERRADDPRRELDLLAIRRRLELLDAAAVSLHRVDARDHGAVGHVFTAARPDAVVHLAGIAHAGRANAEPFLAFEHGMRTLACALEHSRRRVARFVFLSSSMVYGHFESASATEEHPLRPLDAYGALKLCGEELVRAYQRVAGLAYTIVRPCALYGPRCISRRVTQVFVENAFRGQPIISQCDAEDRIDFTYVDDLADGLALALGSPAAENETFNLTAGDARSLADLTRVVQQIFPTASVEQRERDALQPRRGTLAIDKARRLLGYAPSVSLEVGIPRCVAALTELCGVTGIPAGRDAVSSPLLQTR